MEVDVEGKAVGVDVGRGSTVLQVMQAAGLSPDEYIAVLDGQVVTEHEEVLSGCRLEFVRVWSVG